MSPVETVQPVFYIIFGAFMALAGLHLWQSLQKRFSRGTTHAQAKSFAYMVNGIDQVQFHTDERQSSRLWHWEALPPLEMAIARLVVQGKSDSEIARDLAISGRELENHFYHMYDKLEVRSRVELARTVRDLVD